MIIYQRMTVLVAVSIFIFMCNLFYMDRWGSPVTGLINMVIAIFIFYAAVSRIATNLVAAVERNHLPGVREIAEEEECSGSWIDDRDLKLGDKFLTLRMQDMRIKSLVMVNRMMMLVTGAVTILIVYLRMPGWVELIMGAVILVQGFAPIILQRYYLKKAAFDSYEFKRWLRS